MKNNFIRQQWRIWLLCLSSLGAGTAAAQAPRPFPAGLDSSYLAEFRALEKLYDATNGDNWTGWTATNRWFTADLST
ncbi:MAG: hypothetical protein RLZZ628_2910, partial [Bacteroidota bacterium]